MRAELEFAEEVAREGAQLALDMHARARGARKADGSWVTEADDAVERLIRYRVREAFPDHAVLGEEHGRTGPEDAPTWVVDPIDGTTNYVGGIPIWATLVALRVDGESVVGAVSAPLLGETYAAARGLGATMNGAAIAVAPVEQLDEATVIFGGARHFHASGRAPLLQALVTGCARDRALGDFWGHVLVARGAAHVMVEAAPLTLWDVAALEPIVAEAGGRLTALDGSRWTGGPALTTCGALHEAVAALAAA